MPEKITQKLIERTPFTTTGQKIMRDSDVAGLMLVIGKTTKTWLVKVDAYATEPDPATGRRAFLGTRKRKIGDASGPGAILPDEARRMAREVKERLKRGGNAQEGPRPATAAPVTLRMAAARFLADRRRLGRSPRTVDSYEADLRNYLKPFLDLPLAQITGLAVADLHLELTGRIGPVTANGAMRTLRAIYNAAARIDDLPMNPVTRSVEFNPEPPKQDTVADLADWYRRVQRLTPIRRDLQLFILMTGMRKTAACEAKVEDLDLDKGFLFVPKPKGGERRAFYLPLSNPVVDLLSRRVAENARDFGPMNRWLFPSFLAASGHVEEVKEKGLPGPHTLRRTFATVAAEAGLPPADIGILLNHAIPGVTGRYIVTSALGARLRELTDQVAALLITKLEM